MIAELIHRLISKKLFAALCALVASCALILVAMFTRDREVVMRLVEFMGGPAVASMGYFIHQQGGVDKIEAAQ